MNVTKLTASFLASLFLIISLTKEVYSWPFFHLYTRSNPINFTYISSENITKSNFNFSKDTVVIIHGHSDSGFLPILIQIKDSILKLEDKNLILVDWAEGARELLKEASANAILTGKTLGNFILNAKINSKQVHCIGQGLGAHSCGFAGKITTLKRISGMDPVRSYFEGNSTQRLDKTDADFVDVIHADAASIQDSIGHKDYFPNGGKLQPGCEYDPLELLSCSYKRVPFYYSESIISLNDCIFFSIRCDSYEIYQTYLPACDCGGPDLGCPAMGYFDKLTSTGNFYLETKKSPPYCVR